MTTSISHRIIASYVAIFLLSRELNYPIPDKLVRVLENSMFGAFALMFGASWAATQDSYSCLIAIVIYAISVSVFHEKNPDRKYGTFEEYITSKKSETLPAREIKETSDKLYESFIQKNPNPQITGFEETINADSDDEFLHNTKLGYRVIRR